MITTKEYTGETLVIRRMIKAPIARVWTAFSDPAESKLWGAPEEMHVQAFDADLRVGGAFHLVMEDDDTAEQHIANGIYQEIVPQERIVYTWTWEVDPGEEPRETLVTWEFRAVGSETELTLTHNGLASVESRDRHNYGWTQMFDKFERYLGG